MKITFIGHASLLVEVDGISILSDPWWRSPCFGAQWWNYPKADLTPLENTKVDFIYISHGHHDHYHPGTLRTLNRDAMVLVAKDLDLENGIRELGFNVTAIGKDEEFALTDKARCRIIETHNQDTLMTITDGVETFVNLNDSLHATSTTIQDRFIRQLRTLHPTIDYVFCGYGVASHFPGCYVIPDKDVKATAAKRQSHFNRQWARIISGLTPRFGFPFAADVVLLENELFPLNEPIHNSERPTDLFKKLQPSSTVNAIDISPGFQIEDGAVTRPIYHKPLSEQTLREECSEEIARAGRYGTVKPGDVEQVHKLLAENLLVVMPYLQEYAGDYSFCIKFRNTAEVIEIHKRKNVITSEIVANARDGVYDVVMTTRVPYLRWSLSKPHGSEILYVGSGCLFEYASRDMVRVNLHRELVTISKLRKTAPKSRFGRSTRLVFGIKQLIKKLLGRVEPDLYDLNANTVYRSGR